MQDSIANVEKKKAAAKQAADAAAAKANAQALATDTTSLFHEGAIRTTQHLSLGTFTLRETGRRLMNLPDHREQLRDMIDKEIDSFQKMYLMDMKVKNLIFVGDQNLEPFSHLISDKGDLSVDALNFQKEIEKALKKEDRTMSIYEFLL